MKRRTIIAAAIAAALCSNVARAGGEDERHGGRGRGRGDGESVYAVTKLVADKDSLGAKFVDPNLVNSWGIAASQGSFWWVADNGTGVSTLYDGTGAAQSLVVSVSGAGGPASPTGVVANPGKDFVVSTPAGDASGAAAFIFASEDGTISGWNSGVPPPAPSPVTEVKVDRSSSAVYKGLAIDAAGDRLYATNFHDGTVDVYDGSWNPVDTRGGFQDRDLPAGYAPFGIRVIGEHVFVTYALQDDQKHDDAAGEGHGFVDEFTLKGRLVRRVASRGKLNSPWGLALAPDGFGSASGHLLVGNFGDGHLMAFDFDAPRRGDGDRDDRGAFLEDADGPIVVDGLWGIGFGNGNRSGPANVLYFAAGPNGEADGLFGRIDLVPGALHQPRAPADPP